MKCHCRERQAALGNKMTLLKCRWLTFSRGWWGVFTFSTYINSVVCLKGRGVKVFRAPLSRLILSVPLCFNLMSFFVLFFAFKTLRMPLSLKYACPSESTWKLAVSSLLKVLSIGLPVARQHASSGKFDTMWPELANAFEDFLFTKR